MDFDKAVGCNFSCGNGVSNLQVFRDVRGVCFHGRSDV